MAKGDDLNHLKAALGRLDFEDIRRKGKELRDHPEGLADYVSLVMMQRTVALDAVFQVLIEEAGNADSVDGTLKTLLTAAKIHAETMEMLRPMARRIMGDLRKGLNGHKRQSKQVSGSGGSGPEPRQLGGGGAGQPRTHPDPGA
jgi:hypothetical protein